MWQVEGTPWPTPLCWVSAKGVLSLSIWNTERLSRFSSRLLLSWQTPKWIFHGVTLVAQCSRFMSWGIKSEVYVIQKGRYQLRTRRCYNWNIYVWVSHLRHHGTYRLWSPEHRATYPEVWGHPHLFKHPNLFKQWALLKQNKTKNSQLLAVKHSSEKALLQVSLRLEISPWYSSQLAQVVFRAEFRVREGQESPTVVHRYLFQFFPFAG